MTKNKETQKAIAFFVIRHVEPEVALKNDA